jgi:hypothetical protein
MGIATGPAWCGHDIIRGPPVKRSIIATLLSLAVIGVGTGACTPGDGAPPQIALAMPPAPGTCAEWIGQPVERTCIPRMALADVPLTLEIEERCGACGTTAESCNVVLEGRTLTLSLDGKTCEPPAGTACRDVCGKNRVRCAVPPLAEGRYVVRYGDTSRREDSFDVVLRRDAATSCSLDDG